MTPKVKNFAINALRKAFVRWRPRTIVLDNARCDDEPFTIPLEKDRSRNKYKCASCGGVFRKKEINVDHIEPVVNPSEGFVGFESYVRRLLTPVSGLQVLCIPCHQKKTAEEAGDRAETRRRSK